jgi:hypothetical protein
MVEDLTNEPAMSSDSIAFSATTSVICVENLALRDRGMTATVHPRAGVGVPG